jgi:Arc/MetJ-type ribon-helix-helix transcriptional regulator
MPMPKHREPLVTQAVEITVRQREEMRAQVTAGKSRSVSEQVRQALDRWLGFDTATIDPRSNEQEVA